LTMQCAADEGGPLATEEEANRLEAILKAFPTTEEEDAALLASGGPFV
jgi:hypothetical protein